MSLHNDIWCSGTNVYIELFQNRNGRIRNQFFCGTLQKFNFEKGATLSWTNFALGFCATKDFDGINDIIDFKILSKNGDDFCPKILTITMNNGEEYISDEMRDWVDNSKGNDYRIAKRPPSKSLIT